MLVGRTDPALDPKGVLTVQAVDNAAAKLHDPALKAALNSFSVYPEESLVGRLQSGQLDAGFFYGVEADAAHIPTVSLAPVYKYAVYTLTILNHVSDPAGAAAFVRFLLNAERTAPWNATASPRCPSRCSPAARRPYPRGCAALSAPAEA